ncbi:MAG: hypothetical protein HQ477_11415 [Chloroflexi bacterium]|nr:hypothetical protein [Chloroflexota bacterium]
MHILVPATSTKDWQKLLRDPVKQWRHGYSAKSLADHWQDEKGFPADVQRIFTSASVPGIRDAEMLLGVPEAGTKLPGGGYDSQTDLFVLAKSSDGLITITVEGKVNESFDQIVEKWLHKDDRVDNRMARLEGLCGILGINVSDAMGLRYQLLHRTASALIEAENYSATTGIMLVHSFSSDKKWYEDYEAFGTALGVSVEYGQLVDVGVRSGRRLMLGWLTSPVKEESDSRE